eukprot:jgi/Mesen1/4340/ME000022S03632
MSTLAALWPGTHTRELFPMFDACQISSLNTALSTTFLGAGRPPFKSIQVSCEAVKPSDVPTHLPSGNNAHPPWEQGLAFSKDVTKTLFSPVLGLSEFKHRSTSKVTVVGVGNVGMACAQTILTGGMVEEIALVDVNADKLRGEMLDLQHAAAFLPRCRILADTDYSVTAGSDLCIVTAGARQREGETRLSLVGRNVNLLKTIIPQLVKHSPNAILLLIANPVDILSWAAWKISGLPHSRVIGSGTKLDSSRFRFLVADALDVNIHNVHGYIVGEHGDSSVPLWSSVSVGGVPVLSHLKEKGVKFNDDILDQLHEKVVQGAYEVIRLKGYTSWAIGYSVASLASSILRNERHLQPVSVLAKGLCGIEREVYLSLPAVVGREGIISVVNTPLSDQESSRLLKSANTLWEIQESVNLEL